MGVSNKIRSHLKKRYVLPRFKLPQAFFGKYAISIICIQKRPNPNTCIDSAFYMVFPHKIDDRNYEGIALTDDPTNDIYYGDIAKIGDNQLMRNATEEEILTFMYRYCRDCDLDIIKDFTIYKSNCKNASKTISAKNIELWEEMLNIKDYFYGS